MNLVALHESLRDIGLNPTAEALSSLNDFDIALGEANEKMNLTRVAPDERWVRHYIDSILFHDLIATGSKVLDIGTGPGFPAWPLALFRPDLTVTALDSSGKMLGFLRSSPLPNLEIVQDRAESWGVRNAFDVVTGRALAPLSIQLELSVAPCRVGGLIIPMRTDNDVPEIDRLAENPFGLELIRIERRILPVVEAPRVFPIFQKTGRTASRFPRSWAEIRKKPI